MSIDTDGNCAEKGIQIKSQLDAIQSMNDNFVKNEKTMWLDKEANIKKNFFDNLPPAPIVRPKVPQKIYFPLRR